MTPEISKIEEKLANKAAEAETAVVADVQAEKGWFAKNWKLVAVGVVLFVALCIGLKL